VHYEAAVGDSVSHAFEGFDVLNTADVAMVNLECPVTTRGTRVEKPFNFRMHPRFLTALTSAGIDIVNVANNHIYDFGPVGLFDTISYLDSVGIGHVGAGKDVAVARAPLILEVRNTRIAFLGYYGGREAPKATRTRPGVADRRVDVIRHDLEALRKSDSVDYVVVNLHWGTEKADRPDKGQVYFAHRVIEAGADLIIGHHPHVLQGVEKYKGGVVVYSLGNLVFGGNSRSTYDTAVFEVTLTREGANYRVIPVRLDQWRLRELSGYEADSVVQRVRDLSGFFSESIFAH
jgi:poly-gamma-glutamate synthesis protein (capsule biosynthesis protein)